MELSARFMIIINYELVLMQTKVSVFWHHIGNYILSCNSFVLIQNRYMRDPVLRLGESSGRWFFYMKHEMIYSSLDNCWLPATSSYYMCSIKVKTMTQMTRISWLFLHIPFLVNDIPNWIREELMIWNSNQWLVPCLKWWQVVMGYWKLYLWDGSL